MFHFLGEFLVAVTWKIRNRLLVFGFVVAVVNIQQFQYSGLPFVLVLLGEFLAHQEYQIAYTDFLSRFDSQLAVAGLQVHIGIEIQCGNFLELFSNTYLMNERKQFHAEIFLLSVRRFLLADGVARLVLSFPVRNVFFQYVQKKAALAVYVRTTVLHILERLFPCSLLLVIEFVQYGSFLVIFSLAAFIFFLRLLFLFGGMFPIANGIILVVGFIQRLAQTSCNIQLGFNFREYLSMC